MKKEGNIIKREVADIDRLCDMTSLTLSAAERDRLASDISDMLEFAAAVCDAADDFEGRTCEVRATVLREDEARCEYSSEEMLSATTAKDRGCPFVLRVIE